MVDMSSDTRNAKLAFDTLTVYLRRNSWAATIISGQTAYRAEKNSDVCPIDYFFQIKEELEQFLFYISPKINVLKHMLPNVAEYICRANHGLRIGNFEVDFNDGQISFKSSMNFKGLELTEKLIENVIEPALIAFDEFFPGLANVIADIDTPARAIRKVEYGK
jgi:hypothetical protein